MNVYWNSSTSKWRYDLDGRSTTGRRYHKSGFLDDEECARARDAIARQFYPHLKLNFPSHKKGVGLQTKANVYTLKNNYQSKRSYTSNETERN